jgi:hypothetical protein
VEATPVDPAHALYAKTILAIDPERLLVLRADLFDSKGKLLKRWTVERLERVDDVWTATVHQMANVQDGTRSRLELTDLHWNVDIADEVFGRAHLGR